MFVLHSPQETIFSQMAIADAANRVEFAASEEMFQGWRTLKVADDAAAAAAAASGGKDLQDDVRFGRHRRAKLLDCCCCCCNITFRIPFVIKSH
jgi:hypothetical protein